MQLFLQGINTQNICIIKICKRHSVFSYKYRDLYENKCFEDLKVLN